MKPQYTEGPKATEEFERTMTALFRAPKDGKAVKKQSKATSLRKPKKSDKD